MNLPICGAPTVGRKENTSNRCLISDYLEYLSRRAKEVTSTHGREYVFNDLYRSLLRVNRELQEDKT